MESENQDNSTGTTLRWHIYFVFALLCAVWFLFTSWIWIFLINIWISYPVGILAFVLLSGRKYDLWSKRYLAIMIILAAGLLSSIIALPILCFADL